MRAMALDVGLRRIGVAVSDPSGTIARPFRTLTVGDADPIDRVLTVIDEVAREEDGLAVVVVGWPRRLDGTSHEFTGRVERFIEALRGRLDVPVVRQDERLTSHEAEARLAERARDWRRRKERLDEVAASVILQDYLDECHRRAARSGELEP
jgi:putative Holliday junction resolvase